MRRDEIPTELNPDLLLRAYAAGIFPMSESYDDPTYFWVNPKKRGVLPLDCYHLPRDLKKIVRQNTFRVTFNKMFEHVVDSCSKTYKKRNETWINKPIRDAVIVLHKRGFAHSVECWFNDDLVGGLYGISLGSAFFGESMFSKKTNASKVALVYLLAQLTMGKFRLLDTQFKTDHLARFGVVEISSKSYLGQLEQALKYQSLFNSNPPPKSLELAISSVLQNSKKLPQNQ